MVLTSGSWRSGAAAAVLVFVLAACGSDDAATDAGAGDDGGAERAATSVADATGDESAGDEADQDAADDDADGDHGDEDHGDDDADEDHGDEDAGDHGDEDHDDEHEGDHEDDKDADHDEDEHDDHDDESSGGLGAHEHGVAELSVAWSGGDVIVDLISPTHNIFGFEYEPSTDEERALVADRTAALSEPGIIALNDEAGCEPGEETTTEVEFEGSHAELTAFWMFSCDNPDDITQLDVAELFAEFPNLEDIDAQWASPSGQSAAELSPTATVLDLG